jgi:hypothetical protein
MSACDFLRSRIAAPPFPLGLHLQRLGGKCLVGMMFRLASAFRADATPCFRDQRAAE